MNKIICTPKLNFQFSLCGRTFAFLNPVHDKEAIRFVEIIPDNGYRVFTSYSVHDPADYVGQSVVEWVVEDSNFSADDLNGAAEMVEKIFEVFQFAMQY